MFSCWSGPTYIVRTALISLRYFTVCVFAHHFSRNRRLCILYPFLVYKIFSNHEFLVDEHRGTQWICISASLSSKRLKRSQNQQLVIVLMPWRGPVNRRSVCECEFKVTEWAIKERRDSGVSAMAGSSVCMHESVRKGGINACYTW